MEFVCCVSVDCITGGGKLVDMLISFIKYFVGTYLLFYMNPRRLYTIIAYEYIAQGLYFLNSPPYSYNKTNEMH
jgi:uncharacterized membrane protein YjjP (DUF1212 family)